MKTKASAMLVAVILVPAAQVLLWQCHARQSLAYELPSMIRHTFIDAERRMHPFKTWPDDLNLVLAESTDPSLESSRERFEDALNPTRIRIQTERQARENGILSASRCRECVVVHYREAANTPLFARVRVSFSGGEHASGYEQTWVNVLGSWVHLRTQLSWMT